ncbi:MAG TPA: hypothetical protein DD473_04340, partial [Planctomycetaceae bacterium]|nr:hypothetical protein [Planctomycetaceae bacterium]
RLMQSMIGILSAVSGVVFSVSMLVIAQASSQFGPRIVRIFAKRQITQWTLGAFLGSTLYCLLVLWQIPLTDSNRSLMPGTVFLGLVSGLVSLLLLIRYIYAVAELMQVQTIIRDVSSDLDSSIERLFPESDPESKRKSREWDAKRFDGGEPVYVGSQGYVQAIAYHDLAYLAARKNYFLRLSAKPGEFVTTHEPVIWVMHESELTDETRNEMSGMVLTGKQRTPRQDVECALRELVEIALRALSPGINDPYTAMSCIDYLGATLARMCQRESQQTLFFDDEDQVRLYAPRDDFQDAFRTAFHQIRIFAANNPAVIITMLKAMKRVATSITNESQRMAIRSEAEILNSIITETWGYAKDREPALEWYELLMETLKSPKEGNDPEAAELPSE